jgi:UDP-N-acetyl-D-glucosamine dehydrogenase
VAFKPNVRDARNSPAADVVAGLRGRGATVTYHDPHVATFRDADGESLSSTDLDELLGGSDVVVVVTAHRAVDLDRVYREAALVVDTVNSSAGRSLQPRGVLRLGAGWSAT